ncbi:unnamed protein product [Paramecium sonneborni]|uniref:Uncharacterized protein n=1 Tax=Paramecium sonneborni TaxID=65129 RepID=A0A8S1RM23_9CILI|nr:unnamed protein product [Paramecium sonneborni]
MKQTFDTDNRRDLDLYKLLKQWRISLSLTKQYKSTIDKLQRSILRVIFNFINLTQQAINFLIKNFVSCKQKSDLFKFQQEIKQIMKAILGYFLFYLKKDKLQLQLIKHKLK